MANPNRQIVLARFDKCPNCGSERRLMKELVEEMQAIGKTPKVTRPCLQLLSSVAANPAALAKTLVGAKIATGSAILDACMDCGTIYAVELLRGEIQQTAEIVGQPLEMPPFGRAA